MAIPFTDREIEKAWRENKLASKKTPRTNAHRLLLFYADKLLEIVKWIDGELKGP